MVRALPKIKVGDELFYFDERIRQVRNVKNPHEFFNLTEFETIDIKEGIKARKIKTY